MCLNHMQEIGRFFGTKRETSRSVFTGSTFVYDLPHELTPLAYLMYQLVRGPMLGISAGNPDERALLQTLFLKAGFDESCLLIAPKLYIMDSDETFRLSVPTESAMKSDVLLILDHGTQVLVWLGSDTRGGIDDIYQGFITQLTNGRFPVPDICVFKEGSSDCHNIGNYLIPDDNATCFKASGTMHGSLADNIRSLKEPSLVQWCHHYYVCIM